MKRKVTFLQNYSAARQFSILSYGDFIYRAALLKLPDSTEVRPRGWLSSRASRGRKGRLILDLNKYIVAPVEMLAINADILHISDNSNAWYSFFTRSKTVSITCHDMIAWLACKGRIEGWYPSLFARILMHANLYALKRADSIVSVSLTTKDVLIEAGVQEKKISLIYNCILQNLPEFGNPAKGMIEEDIENTFIHFGAGKFPKNTESVIEAFSILSKEGRDDLKLILVGEEAEVIFKKFSSPKNIYFYKSLSAGEISYLYQKSAGVLMPSRYEGFGLPVIEAQAAGCPVICTDGGALDEVMAPTQTKISHPADPKEMARLIKRLVVDRDFRRDVVASGFENASRFKREDIIDAYGDYFLGLAKRSGAS